MNEISGNNHSRLNMFLKYNQETQQCFIDSKSLFESLGDRDVLIVNAILQTLILIHKHFPKKDNSGGSDLYFSSLIAFTNEYEDYFAHENLRESVETLLIGISKGDIGIQWRFTSEYNDSFPSVWTTTDYEESHISYSLIIPVRFEDRAILMESVYLNLLVLIFIHSIRNKMNQSAPEELGYEETLLRIGQTVLENENFKIIENYLNPFINFISILAKKVRESK